MEVGPKETAHLESLHPKTAPITCMRRASRHATAAVQNGRGPRGAGSRCPTR